MKPLIRPLPLYWLVAAALVPLAGRLPPHACAQPAEGDRQALADLRTRVERGDAAAQYDLGQVSCLGWFGVKTNYMQAINWYRKAAEQGFSAAQYNLGVCHHRGMGVETNDVEAAKWIRRAAEQGDADAQYNLDSKDKVFALQSACLHGCVANVRWLLGQGVPANATNLAETPLLVEHKAETSLKDAGLDTPADLARKKGYFHIETILQRQTPPPPKPSGNAAKQLRSRGGVATGELTVR